MSCNEECKKNNIACKITECRYWINYKKDLNCTLIAINKHGSMTLREVAKRIGLSYVRIKHIEDDARKKVYNKLIKKQH